LSLSSYRLCTKSYRLCTKNLESYPRQWVDSSRSFLLELPNNNLRIPPTAVGGSFKSFLRNDLKYPPTAVGWDYSAAKNMFCRQQLKNPPTTVGGIFTFCAKPLYMEFPPWLPVREFIRRVATGEPPKELFAHVRVLLRPEESFAEGVRKSSR